MVTRRRDEILIYCRLSQEQRASLRAALHAYRLAGGKVRTADFVTLWRQAAERRAAGR